MGKIIKCAILVVSILFSRSVLADPKDTIPTTVTIPLKVAKEMWKDVLLKNELQVELNQADSTVSFYEMELEQRGKKIAEFGLTVDEYTVLIKKMDEQHNADLQNYNSCQQENKRIRRKVIFTTVVAIAETVLIVLIVLP